VAKVGAHSPLIRASIQHASAKQIPMAKTTDRHGLWRYFADPTIYFNLKCKRFA